MEKLTHGLPAEGSLQSPLLGGVYCQNEPGVGIFLRGQRYGASFAAAMVTGMVSTWLSDDEFGG